MGRTSLAEGRVAQPVQSPSVTQLLQAALLMINTKVGQGATC